MSDLVKTKSSDYTKVNIINTKDISNQPLSSRQQIGPTTSLLDSRESVVATNNRNEISGFPTSSWTQFWILLKRTFITICRDQTLTQMRMVSHCVVGAIIGLYLISLIHFLYKF